MGQRTVVRRLIRTYRLLVPLAVAIAVGAAAPVAVGTNPGTSVGLTYIYTYGNCNSTKVVDPVDVVFKGGNPKAVRVDHTLGNHGWSHDDYDSPIIKAAELFHVGGVDKQYIHTDNFGCKVDRDQAATGSPVGNRDHVRLFESAKKKSTGGYEWFVVGDAHHDKVSTAFEGCHQVHLYIPFVVHIDIGGHIASEYIQARENLAKAWPGKSTLAQWKNVFRIKQCNGETASNEDGDVRILNAAVASESSGIDPENTSAPVLGGSGTPGKPLSVSNGTWSETVAAFTYKWCYIEGEEDADECHAIPGATTNTWTPQASDKGKIVAALIQPVGAEAKNAVLSNAVAVLPAAPTASTEGAQNVQYTTAEVTGSVNPNGGETHYDFEYGETLSYGKVVPVPEGNAGSGTAALHVVGQISGLNPATVYHYRLVARNASATIEGEDKTFRTRGWKIEQTVDPEAGTSIQGARFAGVACWSDEGCSSAGLYYDAATEYRPSTLVEQWPGSGWELRTSPNPTPYAVAALESISCLPSSECTASGYYETESGQARYSLAMRWSGSVWSVQATPSEGHESNLVAVSCPSATECVAGGYYVVSGSPSSRHLLIESWNGTEWAVKAGAKLPVEDEDPEFTSISCSAPKNCIAVGRVDEGIQGVRSLAESWNGTSWKLISPPRPPHSLEDELEGVSCSAPKTCTAVGKLNNTEVNHTEFGAGREALVERWNGTSWTVQEATNPEGRAKDEGLSFWSLSKVSCASETACVAVGNYGNGNGTTLLLGEYWDGSTWNVESPTNRPGAEYNTLTGVSCSAPKTCTTVGYSTTSGKDQPLAERLE
jgi:hypothetical protein